MIDLACPQDITVSECVFKSRSQRGKCWQIRFSETWLAFVAFFAVASALFLAGFYVAWIAGVA